MKYKREIKEDSNGQKYSEYTGGDLPEGFAYHIIPYNIQERVGEKSIEEKIDYDIKRKVNLPG